MQLIRSQPRALKLLAVLAALVATALTAEPVSATGTTKIESIVSSCQSGDRICATVTVSNPQDGLTVMLKLTGHKPGMGDGEFEDTGAPHVSITLNANQTVYEVCFENVSLYVEGKGYNTLRIEVVAAESSPGLEGTTTKSLSFICPGVTPSPSPSPSPSESPSPSPSPSESPSPSPSPGESPSPSPSPGESPSPSPEGSAPPSESPSPGGGMGAGAPLAPTGGFDFRILLAGLTLLATGGALFAVSKSRRLPRA